jgi:cytochrome c oxidase subunit II
VVGAGGAGVIGPTVLLSGLLVYSLTMLPELLAPAPAGSLRIHVTGEQYWWRVRYLREGQAPIELANELRLPLDQPAQIELESRDVIHSFWVPSLGGKVDAIPGRKTRLRLHSSRIGRFRGACAEYCGTSHAWMAFWVVVQEPNDFERWLSEQAEPAAAPGAGLPAEGAQRFVYSGCGACHTVRGTSALGRIGPDLTHVGSRLSLAAATLDNTRADARRFIASPERIKPGVRMPAFHMLPADHLDAVSAYLDGLK